VTAARGGDDTVAELARTEEEGEGLRPTPRVLTSAFRRRLLALVTVVCLWVAVAPPAVYYVQKRSEIVAIARSDAGQIGAILRASMQARPTLWRYDAVKLAERLRAEGFERLGRLVVLDGRGALARESALVPLDVGQNLPPNQLLWARVDVPFNGGVGASVWVGADARALDRTTAGLSVAAVLAAALLGLLLYGLPIRAISVAERRVDGLLDELSSSLREDERKRIARDLHDGASQALTAARLHLGALGKMLSKEPSSEKPRARLSQALVHIDEAIDEVRRSTTVVTPALLGELGLAEALGRHIESFGAAASLPIRYARPHDFPALTAPVSVALLRIAQEALHNVVRHSGAQRADVALSIRAGDAAGAGAGTGAAVLLVVRDDGRNAAGPEGNGLSSIRARADSLGGSATFSSSEAGSRWDVEIPLR
jgi:signal transduction histidine kinase